MQLIEFSFDAPANSCFPAWCGSPRDYARRTGKILVEEATGELVQSDDALVGFPPGLAWTRVEQVTVWDRVRIGEDLHLLSVSSSQVVYFSSSHLEAIQIQCTNHRHFEAKSNITFQ
jgi:hypothetical protein